MGLQSYFLASVATPPDEGMIQVNMKNDNTRIVRRERTVEVFSHQGPDGSWENYDAPSCGKSKGDEGPRAGRCRAIGGHSV